MELASYTYIERSHELYIWVLGRITFMDIFFLLYKNKNGSFIANVFILILIT